MQHMVRKEGGDIENDAEEIPVVARSAVEIWCQSRVKTEKREYTHGCLLPRLPNSWPHRTRYQAASGRSTSVPEMASPALWTRIGVGCLG